MRDIIIIVCRCYRLVYDGLNPTSSVEDQTRESRITEAPRSIATNSRRIRRTIRTPNHKRVRRRFDESDRFGSEARDLSAARVSRRLFGVRKSIRNRPQALRRARGAHRINVIEELSDSDHFHIESHKESYAVVIFQRIRDCRGSDEKAPLRRICHL